MIKLLFPRSLFGPFGKIFQTFFMRSTYHIHSGIKMIRLVHRIFEVFYILNVERRYLTNKKNAFIKKAIDNYFQKLEEQDFNEDDLIQLINHLSRVYDQISSAVKL
ncbi:hypothetical protein AS888_05705 [Peribacillus simplex]|uniref:Uncharacterized protein n=1 Tax=Peribacillus simplex TaxID=1478 RepID=A0A125QSK1_9BACI|nr:hypothetical protein AS888_05705 [Peribacillus simplex]